MKKGFFISKRVSKKSHGASDRGDKRWAGELFSSVVI